MAANAGPYDQSQGAKVRCLIPPLAAISDSMYSGCTVYTSLQQYRWYLSAKWTAKVVGKPYQNMVNRPYTC